MGGPRHHTEIMDADLVIDAVDQGRHPLPGLLRDAVIGDDGVHVDDRLAAQLFPQLLFHVVDLIVELQHVFRGGDLRVDGDHHPAGTVVVDNEVMDTQDALVGHDDVPDLGDKFMGGRRAQQRVQCVLGSVEAGPEDEGGHQDAAPAIDHEAGEMSRQRGDEHRQRGGAVAEGVHGGGIQLFAQPPVIGEHIQLHGNGHAQDGNDHRAELHRLRVQDLLQGGFGQLHTHEQNEHGYRQAGQVLNAAMAEGMLGVRSLARHLEAQHCHKGGAGVGEVVEGVGGDGDGTGQCAGEKFADKQQNIEANAHGAAEDAVSLAKFRLLAVGIEKHTGEQGDHEIKSFPPDEVRLPGMRCRSTEN